MTHGGGMMDGWSMMGPVMWIFMLLLWGFVIFGVICAVRWLIVRSKPDGNNFHSETPLEILKKRYARGEISKDEFEQRKKDLE